MVLQSPFPPDIRVEKETRTLLKAGYNVFLLAKCNEGQRKEKNIEGVRVRRVNIAGCFVRKLQSLRFFLTFTHPLWRREIEKFVSDFNIEILHLHDLPLVKTGMGVARRKNLPIIVDLHENYPAVLQVWNKGTKGLRRIGNKILFNYQRWIKYEREICHKVDKIIVTVDEMKERLVKTHEISPEKITVASNTEDPEFVKSAKLDKSTVKKYKDRFIISYIGSFGPHRGINTAIKGMVYVKRQIPDALLLLVGKGGKFIEEQIRNLTKENNLEDNVEVLGWQPFNKVYSYMYVSTIGIVPHNKNEHTDHTIPHKLFQYMVVGKPVLVSSCKPLKRVVEETNSGLVFEAGDEKDLADKIIDLYNNENLRKELGKNGKKAVERRYNWRIEAKKLINLYRQLGNYHRRKKI